MRSARARFLYRLAPSRMLARSSLWPGAVAAALAIVVFGYALTLGARLTFQLGTDTRFFAAMFALAAWVYFIAQAILFGAVLNRYLLDARGRAPAAEEREASGAMPDASGRVS